MQTLHAFTANGVTAVTDARGRFQFPALQPGLYTVRIAQTSLGVQRITVDPMPILVDVIENRTANADIQVAATANVVGRVVAWRASNGTSWVFENGNGRGNGSNGAGEDEDAYPVRQEGLANILVEIEGRGEKRSMLTGPSGEFSFVQLRPGEWTVSVSVSDAPPGLRWEKESFTLTAEPAEVVEVVMRGIPRSRNLQLIDEGTVN